MGSHSHPSRRAFIGLAAAVAAVPAGYAIADLAGSGHPAATAPRHPVTPRRLVSENSLPGDPSWPIKHLGAPTAMMGYAAQSSVLPGEPITLCASTTARSFTVSAFRMGWYRGDQARRV